MRYTSFISLIVIFSVFGCAKNTVEPVIDPESPNSPPGGFSISLTATSWDTATITWTKPIDPDNDVVTYKIFLNDSLITSGFKEIQYTFRQLKELTPYTIKIIADDGKKKESVASLQFVSSRYFLKFFKKIEYGRIAEYGYTHETGQMTKANDGGYIIAAKTGLLDPVGGPLQFLVIKINTAGTELWRKYYDYKADGGTLINIINYLDGYLISADRHLLRIDNQGNEVWHRPSMGYEIIQSIAKNSSGSFYTAGYITSGDVIEGSISQYDPSGKRLWNKRFVSSEWNCFYDLAIGPDDQLTVLGFTDTKNSNDGSYEYDFWLLGLTDKGVKRWEKIFHDSGAANPEQVIHTKEGNFLIAGYSHGPYFPALYLQMVDNNGNSIWTYLNEDDPLLGVSVEETNDNSLIVIGTHNTSSSFSYSLLKFDKTGQKLWEQRYSEMGTILQNRSVIPTQDGGYLINCQKAKIYNSAGEFDQIYLFKTDETGNFQ